MRLVDADKLRDKCDEYDWGTIDNEPTVEAIPIDYMLTKAQEWLIDRSITGNEMKFIKDLIKEWENESRG